MLINYSEKIKQFNKEIVEKFDLHLHKMFADKLASSRPYPIKKFDAYLHKTFNIDYPNQDTHEYVDLGLPSGTLWATMNIGANSPEEPGLYFAWGETEGYTSDNGHSFDWTSYKYAIDDGNTLTKYCNNSAYGNNGFTDILTELRPEDDAAYVNWGTNWCMPSQELFQELINSSYTTTTWTTQNGVIGRKITSKSNGNSLFLPAAGYCDDTSFYYTDSDGYYWSHALNTNSPNYAFYLNFGSDYMDWYYGGRCGGRSIRPVKAQQ